MADTRRDRPTARRQLRATVDRAQDGGDLDTPKASDWAALASTIRSTLPAGGARRAWDALGDVGETTLALAQKVLISRLVVVLEAERRSLKLVLSADPDQAEAAAAYLAEIRRGTKQVRDLANSLVALAKTSSDIDVSGLPDEIAIFGAEDLAQSFATPGPTRGAAPRHPGRGGE